MSFTSTKGYKIILVSLAYSGTLGGGPEQILHEYFTFSAMKTVPLYTKIIIHF